MADKHRIYYLLEQAKTRHITDAECAEMEALLSPEEPDAEQVRGFLDDYFATETSPMTVDARDPEWKNMLHAIVAVDKFDTGSAAVHRVHFLRRGWFRYAAAILIVVIGAIAYYQFSHTSQPENRVVHNVPPPSGNDVQPGGNRAVLTLSDGRKVELDSAGARGTIQDGEVAIENSNGQLIYGKDGVDGVAMNTMSTPKGGQYVVRLADGTVVWLNAASSITYPTAFFGQKREVRVTGEVYFEVATNAKQPFVVKTGTDEITVLGTSFNVNAYTDEGAVKTSLVEGKVQVTGTSGDRGILNPGHAYRNGKVYPTNTAQDVAWKNGYFNFANADLQAVMRQLARWYDIEVRYENGIPNKRLEGEIGRNLNLSDVQEVLDNLGIRTTLRNRILTIHSQ